MTDQRTNRLHLRRNSGGSVTLYRGGARSGWTWLLDWVPNRSGGLPVFGLYGSKASWVLHLGWLGYFFFRRRQAGAV